MCCSIFNFNFLIFNFLIFNFCILTEDLEIFSSSSSLHEIELNSSQGTNGKRWEREIDAAKVRSRTSSIIEKGSKTQEVRAIVASRGQSTAGGKVGGVCEAAI